VRGKCQPLAGFFIADHARGATCDAIVGKWKWFAGGEVTFNRDGNFAQQSGNSGTWECTDPDRGLVTLRWRQGGFVNRLALSADANRLSSTDPSQSYDTATRIGTVVRADAEAVTLKPSRTAHASCRRTCRSCCTR
jgi:hypothetical protein